jgi:hypothetical protein
MAKNVVDMTDLELAQEMNRRADSLEHLTARAEMERRRSVIQLRTARYSLGSTIAAAVSATASAIAAVVAAYVAFRGGR